MKHVKTAAGPERVACLMALLSIPFFKINCLFREQKWFRKVRAAFPNLGDPLHWIFRIERCKKGVFLCSVMGFECLMLGIKAGPRLTVSLISRITVRQMHLGILNVSHWGRGRRCVFMCRCRRGDHSYLKQLSGTSFGKITPKKVCLFGCDMWEYQGSPRTRRACQADDQAGGR